MKKKSLSVIFVLMVLAGFNGRETFAQTAKTDTPATKKIIVIVHGA